MKPNAVDPLYLVRVTFDTVKRELSQLRFNFNGIERALNESTRMREVGQMNTS